MELEGMIPNDVTRQQIQEILAEKRAWLGEQNRLYSSGLEKLTLRRLKQIMRTVQADKQELNGLITEYLCLDDGYPEDARVLARGYDKVMRMIEGEIHTRYESRGK